MESRGLHVVDWLVFAAMLAISCGIGLYHSFSGGKQKTVKEYVQGDGRIKLIPAAISLTVSFISSILILGHPAEVYTFGIQYWMACFASMLSALLACLIYVPVFYPLKMVSVNELFYSAIVSFGQATCIEAISGFPTWAAILIGNSAAVLYTTLLRTHV